MHAYCVNSWHCNWSIAINEDGKEFTFIERLGHDKKIANGRSSMDFSFFFSTFNGGMIKFLL